LHNVLFLITCKQDCMFFLCNVYFH
jgi:hypothetical protein